MADDFPGIEPTTFDTIVIGTGLQESILAAAAASAGHSVLHLDPCPFYGLHWTSLSLDDFTAWAAAGGRLPFTPPSFTQINGSAKPIKAPDGEDLEIEPVTNRVLYSDFEISSPGSESLGPSRDFNLDIAGPKLAFCGGPLVDLLMKAGASNYVEFRSVEASYIWSGGQGLMPVPDSRASIFQDRTLSLVEKRHLMRFFKLVQNYGDAEELNSEVLESRFVDFLDQQRLPSSIKSIILYAIALADHDQEHGSQEPNTVLKTKDGIDSLRLYLSSIGRFVNASGAFLFPAYGQAELPQAFSRAAAVKGTIYVLRMPVTALLIGKENGTYKGIQIASGQYLFSDKLVVNASVALPAALSSSLAELRIGETESRDVQESESSSASVAVASNSSLRIQEMPCPITRDPFKISCKVARIVCITNQSLKAEFSTLMVIFPPRSILSKQQTAIRALQLGSNTSACPRAMFVVYFSTLCSDIELGKEILTAAINSLFIHPNETASEHDTEPSDSANALEGRKPTLLWSTFFVQHSTECSEKSNPIAQCCMPDETLDYRRLVMSTTKIFQDLFPGEELFPRAAESVDITENVDDVDDESTLLN